MKIVYLGTPDFAVFPLEKIIEAGYDVEAVVTQPDRPVGRKQILTPSPVKDCAIKHGLKVFQYEKIRLEGVDDLKALKPDLMITCAFGQILSKEILDIPTFGTINIHASLLPKLRGSSPIQWAVINGEKETGVTIMFTDVGVDTGDIVMQKKIEILPDETAGELFDRLSVLGGETVVEALKNIVNGNYTRTPQDHALATHTVMLKKEDGKIDFNRTTDEVYNFIRGMNPWPVAYFYIGGEQIKVFKMEKVSGEFSSVSEIV
ncbi:MAG: methionyl-tRNA formyltransferase, partial [Clostridia bacterium]|nr:methionyl-tRNA formyltransferase [Clostridia bacterium]